MSFDKSGPGIVDEKRLGARARRGVGNLLRTLRGNSLALSGSVILLFFAVIAVFAPWIAPYSSDKRFTADNGIPLSNRPPSLSHPFGTTYMGRDVLSLVIYGSQGSLLVALASGLAAMFIGGNVGLIAGYFGGRIDLILMRLVDLLYGIPTLPFILVLTLFIAPSIWNVLLAVSLLLWRTTARIVRSQAMTLSNRPFINASRAVGAGNLRILYVHLAPNLLPLLLSQVTLVIGWSIILESGASFLGVGANEVLSWGQILQSVFVSGAIRTAWWWVIPPGVCIATLVLSFFLISNGIEEMVSPSAKSRH
ncbi:MAG: ABC transporter permease [Candidatus Acetothermia bacterium]